MSGMVNPRPYIRPLGNEQKPDTMSNRLERLGKNDSGPVKIDKDGRITEGGLRMTLSSGLHFFGLGKPSDDIESNKQTLENVITLLHAEAKQMMIEQNKQWKEGDYEKHWHIDPDTYANKVIESLLKSTTHLDGDSKFFGKPDPGYSLRERYERGTYLSGDLARQIKDKFDHIARGTIDKTSGNMVDLDEKVARQRAEARRRGANFETYGGMNQGSVRRFLGQEVKNEGILPSLVNKTAGLYDGVKGAFDKLMGAETRDTAFERTLLQIREKGTSVHPSSDIQFWDAFEEHWTRAIKAGPNTIEGREFAFVQNKMEQYANKMAREGKFLDEDMTADFLGRLLTNGPMMGRIGDLRNHNYVTNPTIEDIAKGIELWRDQQPLEVREQISQNDCEWLARELVLSQESDRLLRERAPNFQTMLGDISMDYFSSEKVLEKFGGNSVLSKIYETMAKNYEEMKQPYFMTSQERQLHYFAGEKVPDKVDIDNALRKPTDDKAQGLVRQTRALINLYNPPKWGPDTLARLMGDSIKEVLLDRHNRIEQTMPELQENLESREQLQNNLESFPLLKVQAQRYMDHPELAKQNPTKPSEFIRAIVSDPLIYARTYAEMHRQIQSGQWVSELGPAPTPPKAGAPRKEVEQYEHDKRVYEQQDGREHERFMKEAIRIRGIERDILNSQLSKFEVLDEVQQTIEEYRKIDLKTLRNDPEKIEAFGRKLDELRQKGQQMGEYCFDVINDRKRNMQITDAEATDIIWAVSAGWCDIDAMLNTLELDAGRVQSDIGRLLEAPKLESANQTLRETDTNLRHALEDSLKALERGDREKMERASDELKRLLVSAFDTAFPLLAGEDEPQARQLLDLISRATRVGVELDRTPQLRGRGGSVEGWEKLVSENEDRLYSSRVESQLSKVLPPEGFFEQPIEKPTWVNNALYDLVLPFPALQFYVSQLKVGPNDGLVSGSQSITKLFENTALNPLRRQMYDEVQKDKKIKDGDKQAAFKQRQEPLSQRWDNKIQPALEALDVYKPLPPAPEKLDRKSIEEYGQTLTQYIETMTKAYEQLLVASTELLNLHGELQSDQQKKLIFDANMVMTAAITIIGEQVGQARRSLNALI